MHQLPLGLKTGSSSSILALGAHCDDIEIGCGGTLLALRESLPEAKIHWVVFTSSEVRRKETLESIRMLFGESGPDLIRMESFRDGHLPYQASAVKDIFEELKREHTPDLIFTHYRHDLHQDHRLVNELTWNTWRDQVILEYEIPKYDGDIGQPNVFFPLTAAQAERKTGAILQAYQSQAGKRWLDEETLRGMLRIRGMESNASERYAEAFHGRKLVLRSD